jgi:hypothetical protein
MQQPFRALAVDSVHLIIVVVVIIIIIIITSCEVLGVVPLRYPSR